MNQNLLISYPIIYLKTKNGSLKILTSMISLRQLNTSIEVEYRPPHIPHISNRFSVFHPIILSCSPVLINWSIVVTQELRVMIQYWHSGVRGPWLNTLTLPDSLPTFKCEIYPAWNWDKIENPVLIQTVVIILQLQIMAKGWLIK